MGRVEGTQPDDRNTSPGVNRRQLTRAALLGAPLAVAAVAAQSSPAQAGSLTAAWKLGGNSDINTDGTNFLGPTDVAPLVFKTAATAGTPVERMRILATGLVGIGTTAPTARLQVHASASQIGVWGRHVSSTGAAAGTRGDTLSTSSGAVGVLGTVVSTSPAIDSAAVRGTNNATNGNGAGVIGTHAGGGYGVLGNGTNGTGVRGDGTYGLWGQTTDGSYGYGVLAYGGYAGLYGSGTYGVEGFGTTQGVYGNSVNGIGVYGESPEGSGVKGYATGDAPNGVVGQATGTNVPYGVWGLASSSTGGSYAGYFDGSVSVKGTLFKSAGSFRIDHPLAPAKKYLSHSFVESPDMMNVYNGNAILDADGTAKISMPEWFQALNRDFRYQLTAIGAPAPDLHVSAKISGNTFRIAGGKPGTEVSWQVTGIRQDAYANAHRIQVEEEKPAPEQGTYLNPGEHGKPASAGVDAARLQKLRTASTSPARKPADLPATTT